MAHPNVRGRLSNSHRPRFLFDTTRHFSPSLYEIGQSESEHTVTILLPETFPSDSLSTPGTCTEIHP